MEAGHQEPACVPQMKESSKGDKKIRQNIERQNATVGGKKQL